LNGLRGSMMLRLRSPYPAKKSVNDIGVGGMTAEFITEILELRVGLPNGLDRYLSAFGGNRLFVGLAVAPIVGDSLANALGQAP
jgi:hypothetical protein